MDLIAGTHTVVGTVTAAMVGDKLEVSYALNAPWSMTESELDIETDVHRIPQTPHHIVIPARFADHTRHHPAVTAFTYKQDITWQPGDTLFLAARAEVVRPRHDRDDDDDNDDCDDRRRDDDDDHDRYDDDDDRRGHHNHHVRLEHHGIAWAAGTRFRPPFGRAMYFTFKPTVTAVVGGGTSWQLARIAGRTTDGTDTLFDDSVYLMEGAGGIAEAPLPADIRAALADDTAPDERFVAVSQTVVSELIASEQAGVLTPKLLAIAEPADPEPAQFGAPSMFGLFGRCSSKDIVKRKVIDLSKLSIPLFSGKLGKNVSANLKLNGISSGSVTIEAHLTEHRIGFVPFCIPFGYDFNNLRITGTATIDYGATLEGTVSASEKFEKQLLDPELFEEWFVIGLLPVRLVFELPISIGADIDASVTGSVSYDSGQRATGTVNYTCTLGGCTGSSSFRLASTNGPATLTGSVSGRIQPSVWAELAFRGALYVDDFLFAQVGVQPFLRGDLWGFLGNDCGDGDGNGVTETVSGLTFDLDSELTFNFATSAFGSDPNRHQLFTTGRHHLNFFDLIGSSALSPVIQGPASTPVGQPTSYQVNMRSCWPYTDRVTHSIEWGDGTSDSLAALPSTGATASHAWSQGGTFTVNATALRDDHGRTLGRATSRDIAVTTVTGGPIPGSGIHLWLRADDGVSPPGGPVASWADQSGNGRDGFMPTAARQPEFVAGALNGKPVIRFAGAQSLFLRVFAEPTNFSVFIVGRNTKASGESIILGPGGSSDNNQLRWDDGTNALFVGTGNGMPVTVVPIGDTRVYHALSARYDGTTMVVYRDGAAVSSSSFSTFGPWTFAQIGAFFSSDFMEGDIAEILIYDRPLSDIEREQVNGYLRDKYGLP